LAVLVEVVYWHSGFVLVERYLERCRHRGFAQDAQNRLAALVTALQITLN
jgi:hypothetical protein